MNRRGSITEEKRITMTEKSAKALIIAGLSGGSGKSVVSVGLAAYWRSKGKLIAPFKKGPDYIDAGWLHSGAGRDCYNLDPYLMTEARIRASFYHHIAGADIGLVEGNRGLYDGVTARGGYSTAELAMLLDLPVILVVNCTKMTRTVAPLVLGCVQFEKDLTIAGVILNQVATKRQRKIIVEAVEYYTDIKVLGAMPRMNHDIFPMRHLGMIPYQEYENTSEALAFLAGVASENLDIEAIESAAVSVIQPDSAEVPENTGSQRSTVAGVTIGVIQDVAFQFYYPENLKALKHAGAKLVSINALEDEQLPELDGLYIGGGFPETSAQRLVDNGQFRKSVKSAAENGLPIYAECGGLIYLGRELIIDDARYPLVGLFDVTFGMKKKPQAHGYSIFTAVSENPFYPVGFQTKGHEFRYSTVLQWAGSSRELTLKMDRGTGFVDGYDGLSKYNVLALYTHVHAEGTPDWAEFFVQRCRMYQKSGFTR
jgi:cobyrinic acid a,c-diamide synthase